MAGTPWTVAATPLSASSFAVPSISAAPMRSTCARGAPVISSVTVAWAAAAEMEFPE